MGSEWAIVAAGAIGATVPMGIEWIRDRGRQKVAREVRAEEAEAAHRALVTDVLNAAAARMRLNLGTSTNTIINEADRDLNQACARLALMGEVGPAERARKYLHDPRASQVELIDDLLVIVANRAPRS